MTDLERDLRSLGSTVAWPPTPDVASRLELRPRRRRALVVAVALAVVALVAAFAVPQSRSAILRFFHLRGVTVERVGTLPPAQELPLAAGLGRPAIQFCERQDEYVGVLRDLLAAGKLRMN